MSELAFTVTGDTFEVPSTVTAWRVRRLKPRGAPELVYARDGRPLTLSIEADLDDLHEAVTTPGKYRLDPIGDDGKGVENVPAAYIQVNKGERNTANDHAVERAFDPRADTVAGLGQAVIEAVRLNAEALRQNAEIAMRAVDRLPQLMEAMTTMLNVATGTQLYALQQREVPLALRNSANDDEGDEDDEQGEADAGGSGAFPFLPGLDINKVVAQVASDVVTKLMERFSGKLPSSVAMDPKAEVPREAQAATYTPATHFAPSVTSSSVPTPASVLTDPVNMAHFLEVKNALTRDEQALVAALARGLTEAEQAAWFNALKLLSVADAVASVRATLASLAQQPPQPPTS